VFDNGSEVQLSWNGSKVRYVYFELIEEKQVKLIKN